MVRAEARGAGEAVCRVTLASIVETKGTDLEIANSRGVSLLLGHFCYFTFATSLLLPHLTAAASLLLPHPIAAASLLLPHLIAAASLLLPHLIAAASLLLPHLIAAASLLLPYLTAATLPHCCCLTAAASGLASRATAAGKRATSPATARKLLNVITAASLVTIHKNARSTGEALCAIIVIRRVTLHVTAHDLGTRAEEIVSQRVSSVRSTLRSQLPLRKQ